MSKVSTKEKVSYVIANVGNIPVMTLVSSFLSIFYVSVLGMDEFKVGTMFLVARIFDGVNDPLIGYIIDKRPESKFGKFRRILIVGSIICALNYALMWFGTAAAPEALKLTVAYISYLLLGITFPIMDISINSLLPVMTDDIKERNTLSSVKMVGYGIGYAFVGIAAPMLLSMLGSDKKAYLTVIGIFLVVIVVCSVGGALGVRQHVHFENDKHYELKDLFKILFVPPVLITFLATILYSTGASFAGLANTYYAQYVLGDVGKLTMFTIVQMLGSFPMVVIVPGLADRYGKKKVYGFGLMVAGIGYVVKALCPQATGLGFTLFYLSSFVTGVGSAFSMILSYGIQADNIDYVEYALDKRSEGAVSALSSMITKIGSGLGGAIPMYILGATKTAEGNYSLAGLMISDAYLPCIFCILGGLLFFLKYPLTKEKIEEIHDVLVSRRKGGAE